jgi:probable HAF family extracellular repeat protein
VISYGSILPGSTGLGINQRGDIVGMYHNEAFVFASGVLTTIATRGGHSWATAINDSGTMAGTAADYFLDGPTTGFHASGGAITYVNDGFPFAGGEDAASAVNNSGTIVGTVHTGSDEQWFDRERQAYTWRDRAMRTWGTLGGAISEGLDINDAGALAGWSTNADGSTELAFLATDAGGMVDLGTLGGSSSRARGLNNLGWVVGLSALGGAGDFDYHAFLYREHGMADLNALLDPLGDWRLVSAVDVNDAGQILAQACNFASDECRAVRLDLIAAVPEPASWPMLLAGLGVLVLRRVRRRVRLALPLLAAPLAAAAAPPPEFSMTLVPAGFDAQGINKDGHIVGQYGDAAAVWDGCTISTIAALAPGSRGAGMNDAGVIVGTWNGNAFTKGAAGMRDLGRYGSWASSEGIAVNGRGDVAGNGAWGPGERGRGWVNSLGVMRVIGTFNGGDWSYVRAINRQGQVVGTAHLITPRSPRDHHGFIYRDRVLQDIGALGDGVDSEAWDINDAGQVVGGAEFAYDPFGGAHHPFLYQDRLMRDLGTLGGAGGMAYGINNAGAVVGDSLLADDSTRHAFLYEGGRMRDLHALTGLPAGWVLVSARDINDRRQILARACLAEDCTMVRLDPLTVKR